MKLITGITLIYLITIVQSQLPTTRDQYNPQLRGSKPDSIYFPENFEPHKEVIQEIFETKPSRSNNVVETEKSKEISSTVQRIPARQSTTEAIGRISLMPQFSPNAPQRQVTHPNRRIPQVSKISTPVQPGVPKQVNNEILYTVTNFGVNLLKNIRSTRTGNVVVSPYCITSLLALLQQGSLGQTQEQLSAVLQMNPATSAAAYSQISTDFKNRNTRNIFKIASNVYVGETFDINRDFKKIAQNNFDSDITPVSFRNSDKAAGQINNWVAVKTNNKIQRLIAPDSIDRTTQLVLVNAVYFKGIWEIPFRTDATVARDFILSNGQIKSTPYMRTKTPLQSGVDATTKARIVLLPFERNEYSLMVILPAEREGISGTLRSLSDARLLSYLSFPIKDIELELPKFTIRAEFDLESVLKHTGISKMFGPQAELAGLGTYHSFSPQISSAIHSAVFSIDEEGGSAAAATSFAAVALSYDDPSLLFQVNRPFIAVLWDHNSSLPLFMAKIYDPQV